LLDKIDWPVHNWFNTKVSKKSSKNGTHLTQYLVRSCKIRNYFRGWRISQAAIVAEVLVLNGPNLNLLGEREPQHYGHTGLDEINQRLQRQVEAAGHQISFFQSNAEHELVERVQQAMEQRVGFIIINPAAYTHTSVALRDALAASHIPFIEVHLSNIHAREPFRRHSYFSDMAAGVISGLGPQVYELALAAAIQHLNHAETK